MRLQWQHIIVGLPALAAGQNFTLPSFDWQTISPAEDLQYYDCYTDFKCARLQLPLNWHNTSDHRKVAIAIIKLPAKVSENDPTFAGSVFTNPGGPGGSGVDLMVLEGRSLQDYIDRPGKRHYEIVSFDPRGVSNSRPVVDCFSGSILARDAMRLERKGLGSLADDVSKWAYGLAMNDGFGKRCALMDEQGLNGGEILTYLGTPQVARDMVEMVDKVDELRKKATGKGDERVELKKRDGGKKDVARLQYIGFSYGTVLGNYFASMFPERIGRIVFDGVFKTDDYSSGAGWLTNTVDADAIIDNLFKGCFEAGHEICALARKSDKSASTISHRFWTWLKKLDQTPISGFSFSGNAIVLTGDDIRQLLSMSSYNPQQSFITLAQVLDSAMQGEKLEGLLTALERDIVGGPLQSACPIANETTLVDRGTDAQHAILCGDGEDVTSKSIKWWQSYLQKQKSTSAVFGTFWTETRFRCSGWRLRANWIFKGPYTTPEPTKLGDEPEKGKPAAPILLLSNRLDPVTPLSAARAVAKNHPGAGVVVQEAMGHCAYLAAYSECTKDIVAEYFDTGKVPDGEVSCRAACGPWDGDGDGCPDGLMTMRLRRRLRQPWFARKFPLGIY